MSKRRILLSSAAALMQRGVLVKMPRADASVAEQVQAALGQWSSEHKAFREATTAAVAAIEASLTVQGPNIKAAVDAANKAIETVNGMAKNLLELEQKVADQFNRGNDIPLASVGQIIINSPEYKALGLKRGETPGSGFKLRVEANTLTGQEGSPPNSADTLVPVDRRPGITPGAFRSLRIKDFLPQVPTSSNAWQFTRELLFTNSAAETAEGAAKPESVLTFEDATVNIRTIAHFIKASNQILADAPALRAYIDTRLTYGVEAREDAQLVAGNGSGQNLSGMTNSGNYTAFTPTIGETALDSLNRAKYTVLGVDYVPTAILMNPSNFGAIERLKEATTGGYLVGDPFGTITPVLWGLPVVLSNNMTVNYFIIADFATSYEYVSRQSTVIDVGYVNDDFTKNLVTIRAEKRGALATIRPGSAYYGLLSQ